MAKKKTIPKLKKDVDKWWSLYIRYRDGFYRSGDWYAECITCKTVKPIKEGMQCGHFQSRRKHSTRWMDENTAAQCVACNMFRQGEQYKFGCELEDRYGEDAVAEVIRESNQTKKWTRPELEQIISDCKEYINHCKNNPEMYAK